MSLAPNGQWRDAGRGGCGKGVLQSKLTELSHGKNPAIDNGTNMDWLLLLFGLFPFVIVFNCFYFCFF